MMCACLWPLRRLAGASAARGNRSAAHPGKRMGERRSCGRGIRCQGVGFEERGVIHGRLSKATRVRCLPEYPRHAAIAIAGRTNGCHRAKRGRRSPSRTVKPAAVPTVEHSATVALPSWRVCRTVAGSTPSAIRTRVPSREIPCVVHNPGYS
jgi:hypothetical protein